MEAELDLGDLRDPGEMARAVADELGTGWGDDGRSRWPHDSWVELSATPTRFITVVVSEESEMDAVLERIETALRRDRRWILISARSRPVTQFESESAMDLVKAARP